MTMKALVVWGGWDGHQPKQVGELFARVLREDGFQVDLSDTLDSFAKIDRANPPHLIVPVWTMGTITPEQRDPVMQAVKNGTGIAGCHGGMCDAFRNDADWQFMTGGQWVAHPGNDGTKYTVEPTSIQSEITKGVGPFEVSSEQYYLHTDPANRVLMTTKFPVADGPHTPNGPVLMPQVWTKLFGKGRVFYSALGHSEAVVASEPHLTIMRRGFAWASGKSAD